MSFSKTFLKGELKHEYPTCVFPKKRKPVYLGAKAFLTDIFHKYEGEFVYDIRCRTCETVTPDGKQFYNLTFDLQECPKQEHSLKCISTKRLFIGKNKVFCRTCGGPQETLKCVRLSKSRLGPVYPFSRYKYMDLFKRHIKISRQIVFPMDLKLFSKPNDVDNPEEGVNLVAVVINCGSGTNRLRKLSIIKHKNSWMLFNDNIVENPTQDPEHMYGPDSDYASFYYCY